MCSWVLSRQDQEVVVVIVVAVVVGVIVGGGRGSPVLGGDVCGRTVVDIVVCVAAALVFTAAVAVVADTSDALLLLRVGWRLYTSLQLFFWTAAVSAVGSVGVVSSAVATVFLGTFFVVVQAPTTPLVKYVCISLKAPLLTQTTLYDPFPAGGAQEPPRHAGGGDERNPRRRKVPEVLRQRSLAQGSRPYLPRGDLLHPYPGERLRRGCRTNGRADTQGEIDGQSCVLGGAVCLVRRDALGRFGGGGASCGADVCLCAGFGY